MKKKLQQKPLSNMEIASFCNQMGMLLRSGISPLEGLNLLLEDAKTDAEKNILQVMEVKMTETASFYDAVESTDLFPTYMLHMIKLGEETGTLDDILNGLSQHYVKEENLSNMIRSALIFPSIMLGMMFLIVIVLLTKVMPIFQDVFQQLGQEMPGFSSGLLRIGQTLSHYFIIFIVLLAAVIAFLYTRKEKLPFQRKLQEDLATCRFADGMSITLKSGLSPEQGLDLIEQVVEQEAFKQKIAQCREILMESMDFSDALHQSHIFTGTYARIAYLAGKAGCMDEAMAQIASEYEQNINKKITSFISILEPTLVIILSVIVGIILFSVMLPLLGIMSGL